MKKKRKSFTAPRKYKKELFVSSYELHIIYTFFSLPPHECNNCTSSMAENVIRNEAKKKKTRKRLRKYSSRMHVELSGVVVENGKKKKIKLLFVVQLKKSSYSHLHLCIQGWKEGKRLSSSQRERERKKKIARRWWKKTDENVVYFMYLEMEVITHQ